MENKETKPAQPAPTFEEVVRPVIEWLANNRSPHCKII